MVRPVKEYVTRFSLAMAAYAAVLILSISLVERLPETYWRIPAALLPVVPVFYAVRAYQNFLHRIDELQQRIQLQALAFSFGATAMLTFAYGLLQNAGLPALSWVWVLPLMAVLWGLGGAVAARRYS